MTEIFIPYISIQPVYNEFDSECLNKDIRPITICLGTYDCELNAYNAIMYYVSLGELQLLKQYTEYDKTSPPYYNAFANWYKAKRGKRINEKLYKYKFCRTDDVTFNAYNQNYEIQANYYFESAETFADFYEIIAANALVQPFSNGWNNKKRWTYFLKKIGRNITPCTILNEQE